MKKEELKLLIKETIHEVQQNDYIEFTKNTIRKMDEELKKLDKMMKDDGYDYKREQ